MGLAYQVCGALFLVALLKQNGTAILLIAYVCLLIAIFNEIRRG